jgi:energy-coupling factor transporter transmembrane protein EcfT
MGFRAEVRTAAAMVGSLLIRSIDSAEHINVAMQARGFDGNWRSISKLETGRADYIFATATACFLLVLHFFIRPVLQ